MSADKFQQQAHLKMEELRLQPNPQVWVEVERRIREKKKRRVILFWLLVAGLLGGSGVFLFINQQGNKNATELIAEQKTTDKKTETNLTETTNKTNTETTTDNNKEIQLETTQKQNELNKPGNAVINKETKEDKTINPVEEKLKPVEKIQLSHPQSSIAVVKQKTKTSGAKPSAGNAAGVPSEIISKPGAAPSKNDDALPVTNPVAVIKNQQQTVKPDNKIVTTPKEKQVEVKKSEVEINTDDSVVKSNIIAERPVSDIKKDTVKKTVNLPAGKTGGKKWEWSINAAIGASRLTEGNFLDLNMNKSADLFNSPTGGSGTPATPVPVSYADSIRLSGPNMQIGFSLKKQLGKKTSFSTGLNFAAYTTRQKVGTYYDSIIPINNDLRSQTYSGFYRAGQATTFKNHYYFIQLPLLFNWQLNRGEKLPPITWENGFLPSFLISSNALAYDKQSRTFYKDKRLYNDVQLNYQTALTVRLFYKRKHPVSAGMFYNFNFSMLQKISPPDYNYLNSFGVKLNWVIKK